MHTGLESVSSLALSELAEVVYLLVLRHRCGQCTPCREGTGWLYDIMTRMKKVTWPPAGFPVASSMLLCFLSSCFVAITVHVMASHLW